MISLINVTITKNSVRNYYYYYMLDCYGNNTRTRENTRLYISELLELTPQNSNQPLISIPLFALTVSQDQDKKM